MIEVTKSTLVPAVCRAQVVGLRVPNTALKNVVAVERRSVERLVKVAIYYCFRKKAGDKDTVSAGRFRGHSGTCFL